MRTTRLAQGTGDRYFALVKQFPLRSIKTKVQHAAAVRFLGKLSVRSPSDSGSIQYIETLGQLIDDYEHRARLKMDLSRLTPVRALKHLMSEHDLTVTELGRLVGSQGTLSDVLAGRRELSKAMIRKLADHFNVSPAVFL